MLHSSALKFLFCSRAPIYLLFFFFAALVVWKGTLRAHKTPVLNLHCKRRFKSSYSVTAASVHYKDHVFLVLSSSAADQAMSKFKRIHNVSLYTSTVYFDLSVFFFYVAKLKVLNLAFQHYKY